MSGWMGRLTGLIKEEYSLKVAAERCWRCTTRKREEGKKIGGKFLPSYFNKFIQPISTRSSKSNKLVPKRRGSHTGLLLKEMIKVRRFLKPQAITDLGNIPVGML
jgi:hypothetical protein